MAGLERVNFSIDDTFMLGFGQSTFGSFGDTLANAKLARDAYFIANPLYLNQYVNNNLLMIRLLGAGITKNKFIFNSQASGRWVNTFNQEVTSIDLAARSVTDLGDVTDAGAGIIPSAADNARLELVLPEGAIPISVASATIDLSNYTDVAGKTIILSAAGNQTITLGDLTNETVWGPDKKYTFYKVGGGEATINSAAARIFPDGTTSLKVKNLEAVTLQGADIGTKVFVFPSDSIHGLAKFYLNGGLVGESDEVNFTGNVVDLNMISDQAQVDIRADQLYFTEESAAPNIQDFNSATWSNLLANGKYVFGGNTTTSTNMPPVKGDGPYICYVDSILRTDQSGAAGTTCRQRLTFSFAGSPPEVFEAAGVNVTASRVNGWARLSTHGFIYAYPYTNNTPVQIASQDTGVTPATLPTDSEVFVAVLFTVNSNSNQYAISIPIDNNLAQLQSDVRQLRSAEPVTGVGDVAFAAWVDGTSGNYHYSLDVDGGGKTLNSVSVVVKSLS